MSHLWSKAKSMLKSTSKEGSSSIEEEVLSNLSKQLDTPSKRRTSSLDPEVQFFDTQIYALKELVESVMNFQESLVKDFDKAKVVTPGRRMSRSEAQISDTIRRMSLNHSSGSLLATDFSRSASNLNATKPTPLDGNDFKALSKKSGLSSLPELANPSTSTSQDGLYQMGNKSTEDVNARRDSDIKVRSGSFVVNLEPLKDPDNHALPIPQPNYKIDSVDNSEITETQYSDCIEEIPSIKNQPVIEEDNAQANTSTHAVHEKDELSKTEKNENAAVESPTILQPQVENAIQQGVNETQKSDQSALETKEKPQVEQPQVEQPIEKQSIEQNTKKENGISRSQDALSKIAHRRISEVKDGSGEIISHDTLNIEGLENLKIELRNLDRSALKSGKASEAASITFTESSMPDLKTADDQDNRSVDSLASDKKLFEAEEIKPTPNINEFQQKIDDEAADAACRLQLIKSEEADAVLASEDEQVFLSDPSVPVVLITDNDDDVVEPEEVAGAIMRIASISRQKLNDEELQEEVQIEEETTPVYLTENLQDKQNINKIYDYVRFNKDNGIKKCELLCVLKQIITDYEEASGSRSEVYKAQSLVLKEQIDNLYAKCGFFFNDGDLSENDFCKLLEKDAEIMKFFRFCIQEQLVLKKDVNIYDEILCDEKSITFDQSHEEIQTASLNRLIEYLTGHDAGKFGNKMDKWTSTIGRRRIISEGTASKAQPKGGSMSKKINADTPQKPTISRKITVSGAMTTKKTGFDADSIQGVSIPQISPAEKFKRSFFSTFPAYTNVETVLAKHLERFEVPNYIDPNTGFLIQTHVLESLNYWLKNYPRDFSLTMINQIQNFIQKHINDTEMDDVLEDSGKSKFTSDDINYRTYLDQMLHEISLHNEISQINTYYMVFSGVSLVLWIVKNVPGHKSIRKAVQFAQNLLSGGYIVHIKQKEKEMVFRPSKTEFYQFKDIETFNINLNMIFNEPVMNEAFRNYCKMTGKEQELLFLRHVEEFKDIADASDRLVEAQAIFDTYLSKSAKTRITIENKVVRAIESTLKQNIADAYLFNDARNKVYYALNNDHFDTFKNTKEYQDCIKMLQDLFAKSKKTPPMNDGDKMLRLSEYAEPRIPKVMVGPVKFNPHKIMINQEIVAGIEFNELDELEIARQLTLISFDYYLKIERTELLGQPWSKTKLQHLAHNLLAFIDRFNTESSFTATYILNTDRVKERAKAMDKFIKIAFHAKAIRNFSTCMAIISAFNSAPILRLKHTKNQLPKASLQMLQELETFFSSNNNYKNYRDALVQSSEEPTIPHMALFLQDLTFIEDGNSSFVNGLINYEQKRQLYAVISTIINCQKVPFRFFKVTPIIQLLKRIPASTEKQLYQTSLVREPRGADPSTIL